MASKKFRQKPVIDHTQSRPLTDGSPKYFHNGWSWEMDEGGSHRLVDAKGQPGDWSIYESPATHYDGSKRFIIFTAYYFCTVAEAEEFGWPGGGPYCEELYELGARIAEAK